MENNELKHYGVLGMRWGVRRTPAQLGRSVSERVAKKRLGSEKHNVVSNKKKGKFSKADGKLNGTGQKAKRQEIQNKKQAVLKSRSAKKLYENADLFTTQELQSAYNRLVLEQNIKNLAPKNVSRGEQFVDSTIKWSKKTASLLETGTKVYNASAKIYNSTTEGKKNPAPIVGEGKKKDKDKDKN